MKTITNAAITDLRGKEIKFQNDEGGGEVSLTIWRFILVCLNNYRAAGPESIKTLRLGFKLECEQKDQIGSSLILEDAEFEIVKRICNPAQPLFSAIVYGQAEEIFAETEKKADEAKAKK